MSSIRRSGSRRALLAIGLGLTGLLGCASELSGGASDVQGDTFAVETATTTTTTTTTSLAREPDSSPCGQLNVATTFFESGSALLSSNASEELLEVLDDQLVGTCVGDDELACPSDSLLAEIVGHTDSRPNAAPGGNQELSEQRAQAVADLLDQRDIDIEVSGVANREPASTTDQEQNRRVEVTLTCQT